MRRRIERSRARCEKAATTNRPDKVPPQPAAAPADGQAQAGRGDP
jgi:hypothetical protein